MTEQELKIFGSLISIFGSVSAIIYGVYRILKIFKDGILKEIENSNKTTISTIEKETLKNEIAINKAIQPITTRVDQIEKRVDEHDKKIEKIESIQQSNLELAIEYKTQQKQK